MNMTLIAESTKRGRIKTYISSVSDALELAERMREDEIERKFQRSLIKQYKCQPSECSQCQHRLSCIGING